MMFNHDVIDCRPLSKLTESIFNTRQRGMIDLKKMSVNKGV